MGQYYIAVILGPEPTNGEPKEFIRVWLESHGYGGGSKLMEHSYINNGFTNAVERLLSPLGPHWKSRVVWAGDYADKEPGYDEEGNNLAWIAYEKEEGKQQAPSGESLPSEYRYVVNHTKRQYVDKSRSLIDGYGFQIHPLPLLTAEGNGRGGGDYRGRDESLVGTWARDVISVEKEVPEGYSELVCEFAE